MAMTRQQLRNKAACAKFEASKSKPLERRRVQSFLSPISKSLNQMMTGEVDAINDRAVTRLAHNDDWGNTDECINGLLAAMERLFPDIDLSPLRWVSSDLTKGKLMSEKKVLAAKRKVKEIEDRLIRCSWKQVIDAVDTTRIEIELERLGIKEAA